MSEPVVLLYDNTSFTGTESKIPLYVFDNLYPGVTTIKSAKIPTGAYFTVKIPTVVHRFYELGFRDHYIEQWTNVDSKNKHCSIHVRGYQ